MKVAIEEVIEVFLGIQEKLRATAINFTRQTDLADVVIQEVYVKITNVNKLPKSEDKIEAWLNTVTRTTSFDLLNKRKHLNEHIAPEEWIEIGSHQQQTPSPETLTIEKFRQALVREKFSQLKPIHQEVLILKYYEDCSVEEIAHRLNISDGTIRSQLDRAKKKLGRLLEVDLFLT